MTSRVPPKIRVRRSAEDRRAEIVGAATRIALRDGLDQVTLRSVAEDLGVVGSLVSHYFPAVDGLLAEAFSGAAAVEREQIFEAVDHAETPLAGLRILLRRLVDDERDEISTLWIDAWHAGRRRPTLNAEVAKQTAAWNSRVEQLIATGVRSREFHTHDTSATAARIMAVVDGLTVQAVIRGTIEYKSVEELVFAVAETELGLSPGTLA